MSLHASIIGEPILQIASTGGFAGTATDLLEKLDELASEKLTGRLKRIAPNVRAKGVMVK